MSLPLRSSLGRVHLPRCSPPHSLPRAFSSAAPSIHPHIASAVFRSPTAPTPLPSPTPPPSLPHQLSTLRRLLSSRSRVLCLTGAGISTESGIPDYRSPGRPTPTPITHQHFMSHPSARQRYWARSMIGYFRIHSARPNPGHVALARAQSAGRLHSLVTQNVDELHERAGAHDVIHLHGNIHRVQCQGCRRTSPRAALQAELEALNPDFTLHIKDLLAQATALFHAQQGKATGDTPLSPAALIPHTHDEDAPVSPAAAVLRPDGDIELQNESFYPTMRIPACAHCGGILKPDVVFFGANVPAEVHAAVDAQLRESDAVLVVGTSLTVWSAYRIIQAALKRGGGSHETVEAAEAAPCLVAVVNDGPTRADPLITPELRLAGRAGDTLTRLFAEEEEGEVRP